MSIYFFSVLISKILSRFISPLRAWPPVSPATRPPVQFAPVSNWCKFTFGIIAFYPKNLKAFEQQPIKSAQRLKCEWFYVEIILHKRKFIAGLHLKVDWTNKLQFSQINSNKVDQSLLPLIKLFRYKKSQKCTMEIVFDFMA